MAYRVKVAEQRSKKVLPISWSKSNFQRWKSIGNCLWRMTGVIEQSFPPKRRIFQISCETMELTCFRQTCSKRQPKFTVICILLSGLPVGWWSSISGAVACDFLPHPWRKNWERFRDASRTPDYPVVSTKAYDFLILFFSGCSHPCEADRMPQAAADGVCRKMWSSTL